MAMLYPTFGRLTLKKAPAKLTSGLIEVVEFEKEDTKYFRGEVVVSSLGYYTLNGEFIKTQFKVGDIVWYYKYNASEIRTDEGSFVMVGENDIIAVER